MELLKACQCLESRAMEFFASHGWPFMLHSIILDAMCLKPLSMIVIIVDWCPFHEGFEELFHYIKKGLLLSEGMFNLWHTAHLTIYLLMCHMQEFQYATNGHVSVCGHLTFIAWLCLISPSCPSFSKTAHETHLQPGSGTGTNTIAVQEAGRFRPPYQWGHSWNSMYKTGNSCSTYCQILFSASQD